MTRCILVLACWAAMLLVPAVAQAIAPAEALRLLNAQRAANGIPGDVVHAPALSRRLREARQLHRAQRRRADAGRGPGQARLHAGGRPPDARLQRAAGAVERHALVGDGQPVAAAADLAVSPVRSRGRRRGLRRRARGRVHARRGRPRARDRRPSSTACPATAAAGVPMSELNREAPYTPQQLAGIPADQPTGPNILLFTRGLRGSAPLGATSFSLTGPQGPVDARLVTEATTSDVGSGVVVSRRRRARPGRAARARSRRTSRASCGTATPRATCRPPTPSRSSASRPTASRTRST